MAKTEKPNIFVGYPPKFKSLKKDLPSFPNTYVMPDKKSVGLRKLEAIIKKYQQTPSPEIALECLIGSHRNEVYPPIDVLEWLAKGLHAFTEGKGRLDACLGFKRKLGRPFNPITKSKYRCIWQDVFFWTKGFNLPQYKAFAIVAPYYGMTVGTFKTFTDSEEENSQWHQCRREIEEEIDRYFQECEAVSGVKKFDDEDLDTFLRKYNMDHLEQVKDHNGDTIDLKNEILPEIKERYQAMGRWYGQPSQEVVKELSDQNIRGWDQLSKKKP